MADLIAPEAPSSVVIDLKTISPALVWFSAKGRIGSLRNMLCVIFQNRLAFRNFVTLRTCRNSSKGHSQLSRRSRWNLRNQRSQLFLSHHKAVQFLPSTTVNELTGILL